MVVPSRCHPRLTLSHGLPDFRPGLPANRRQRRLKVDRSVDHDYVTTQFPYDKSLRRGLSPEISREGGRDESRVGAEGAPRNLHPVVRYEIDRIGSEALRNPFRHAEARQIEVEFRYDERRMRLWVRTGGQGIDPEFPTAKGREGQFGLHGMRERANLMGGRLTVRSASDSGTEIELRIPAAFAYAASSTSRRSGIAEWRSGKDSKSQP